jgi:noranthrone monooxygenase
MYAFAAYVKSGKDEGWHGFAVACVTTVAMIPYTWIFMRSINNKLWAAVRGEKETVNMPEAKAMLNTWSRLNMIRALFPLAGGVLGLLSALKALKA